MGFDLVGTVESDVGKLLGGARGVVSGATGWVEEQWTQRIVQISVYAAILFFVLSSYDLIDTVDKMLVKNLNLKLGKEGTRALHAVTFGFFMYVGVRFILDPFVKRFLSGQVVEGGGGNVDPNNPDDSDDHTDTDGSFMHIGGKGDDGAACTRNDEGMSDYCEFDTTLDGGGFCADLPTEGVKSAPLG